MSTYYPVRDQNGEIMGDVAFEEHRLMNEPEEVIELEARETITEAILGVFASLFVMIFVFIKSAFKRLYNRIKFAVMPVYMTLMFSGSIWLAETFL